MYVNCASGTPFKTATLTVTPEGAAAPLITYRFGLVAIKTLSTVGNQHGGPLPVEMVSFEYGGLKIVYQDPNTVQTTVGSWDRVKNINSFPY